MDSRITALLALHHAEAQRHGMVYEVWEDGEVTLTKGGELYGMRNLHMIVPGDPSKAIPVEDFPPELRKANGHARIQCLSSWDANEAATIIMGPTPWGGTWVSAPTKKIEE